MNINITLVMNMQFMSNNNDPCETILAIPCFSHLPTNPVLRVTALQQQLILLWQLAYAFFKIQNGVKMVHLQTALQDSTSSLSNFRYLYFSNKTQTRTVTNKVETHILLCFLNTSMHKRMLTVNRKSHFVLLTSYLQHVQCNLVLYAYSWALLLRLSYYRELSS